MPIVGWGNDARWINDQWKFKGTDDEKITYRNNSYRVLLTRGREGFIVYIPQGRDDIATIFDRVYGNEEQIGEAIEHSGIPRDEIFLCSKVWHTDLGRDKTLRSFEESCRKLKTDHLDMYLIHWPKSDGNDDE